MPNIIFLTGMYSSSSKSSPNWILLFKFIKQQYSALNEVQLIIKRQSRPQMKSSTPESCSI